MNCKIIKNQILLQSVAKIFCIFVLCFKIHSMPRNNEITIYDIARKLNLSPTTVSRALNGNPLVNKKTVSKVVATAQKMGYQRNVFASNLRTNATRTIGVVIPNINSHFQSAIIAGIEQVINHNGYHVVIAQSSENAKKEQEIIWNMFNLRVDGLLISLSVQGKPRGNLDLFRERNTPLVFFDRPTDLESGSAVIIDNYSAGYKLAQHLIENGCKSFIHLCGNQQSLLYQERNKGVHAALTANKEVKENPCMEINEEMNLAGIIDDLVGSRNPVDGIICKNDEVAMRVIYHLRKKQIPVPTQVAVTGFNDDPVAAYFYPEITTISNPAFDIGNQAATKLINMINHPNHKIQSEKIVLRPNLIVRTSSLLGKTDL